MRYCQEKGRVCQYAGSNMHCRLTACVFPKESLYSVARGGHVMDYDKLIERLRKEAYGSDIEDLLLGASAAIETMRAENAEMEKQLNEFSEFLCHMTGGLLSKTNYTANLMISEAENYQQKVCGECDLWAENEKLRTELDDLRIQWDMYGGDVGITAVYKELEQVKRERDAIEQDFRAFAKQWWEQDSGFPCRWCKFENSGGCEWKAKQPNEEKICAGRAFEWRGQKED